MDYTERPENNMHPDASNFATLAELYGPRWEAPGARRLGGREGRRAAAEFERYAAHLAEPLAAASAPRDGARRAARGTVEVHERRLGGGYSVRTHVLRA